MTSERRGVPSHSRNWRLWIGVAIIVLVTAYAVLGSLRGASVYALTIGDLQARVPSIYGQGVRVGGTVDGASILWSASEGVLRFNLTDNEGTLPVAYKGTRPDMLRDGAQALVEGHYLSSGLFEANKLLLKCPSKYEVAATQTATQ